MTKKKLAVVLGVCALFLSACGGLKYMVKKDSTPTAGSVQPVSGKSAIVIARVTAFGGAVPFATYLDKDFIGYTAGKSFFAKTDIEPGEHHIVSWAENGQAVKVNFEPGKTYYLLQNVSMGVMRARVVSAATDAKFLDSGELSGATFYEFSPKDEKPENLSDSDFKDVIQGADTLVAKADGTWELVPPAGAK
jgi:hypothetical protein